MADPIRSQIAGIGLALVTAIGCLAYERLVKNYSYFVVGMLGSMAYAPFWIGALLLNKKSGTDLWRISEHGGAALIFLLSGISGPIFYFITKKQSAMAGGIYEIKYVVILAIIYILFGQAKFTWNTALGLVLAMASVYFISKS